MACGKENLESELKEAALYHFQAKRSEAVANLRVYLRSASGVAEHPNVVGEITGLIKQVAEAEECISIVEELIKGEL